MEKGTVKNLSELANKFAEIRGMLEPIRAYYHDFKFRGQGSSNMPDVQELTEQLEQLSKRLDNVDVLNGRLDAFASSVDTRDITVRKVYYVGFTIFMAILATTAAYIRVFCPLESRLHIAHVLHIDRIEESAPSVPTLEG